jgi:uncharacterized protein
MSDSQHRNRLAGETSPYLLQHAANPVDWYPWGAEAFAAARSSNRPILLSVGYSACHWCHVMAHESFEDAATARVMNALYVNVKVDREERPDVDRIYQIAQQLLTQRGGGWPLTLFLTPDDQVPFFGGTYFPPQPRHGLPAFRDLLERVSGYYHAHQDEIRAQNLRLREVFDSLATPPAASGAVLDASPLRAARAALESDFDAQFGGFTGAPKFPHPGYVERCLRAWSATAASPDPDLHALYMATLTLTRMAEGGIFDQVGGGFARYSVDAWWMIPHFEKMLYDNGPLLALYAQAWAATGEPLFRRTALATAAWVVSEMQAPGSGFYSSLDADSEGHEGRYYVWDRSAVQAILPDDQYRDLARRFGLDRPANFEGHYWHLHAFRSLAEIAAADGAEPAAVSDRIERALVALKAVRSQRVRPGRDDKILVSWNALMIRGLAIAARALDAPELAESAGCALDFLRDNLWRDGRLYATHKDGRSHLSAYLDDYVFLADAVLELLQCRWKSSDLAFAVELIDVTLAHFEDRSGGFWFTADDAEPLMHRAKSYGDDALPSGNGVAALVLGRLGHLLGEPRYLDAAERTLRAAWPALEQHPRGHSALLDALDEYLTPVQSVVLRGNPAALRPWVTALARGYAPRRMVFAIPDAAADLPPGLAAKSARATPVAYVCEGTHCEAPVGDLAALNERLALPATS